jgi:hypothetical protein
MNTQNIQNVGASQEAVVVQNKKSITDTVMEKAAMAAGLTIIGGVAVTVAAKAAMAVWCVVQLFKSDNEK